jgi:hypothetical protein
VRDLRSLSIGRGQLDLWVTGGRIDNTHELDGNREGIGDDQGLLENYWHELGLSIGLPLVRGIEKVVGDVELN